MNILRVLERVFAVCVVAPPLYLAFRYLRWYFRQNEETNNEEQ